MTRLLLSLMLPLALSEAQATERDWTFVHAVGGIAVQEPVRTGDFWLLPINADVSGLKQVTSKPTMLNSALACKVKAMIEGNTITLVIETELISKGTSPVCPAAKLGNLLPGTYRVNYRSAAAAPIHLRDIQVAKYE